MPVENALDRCELSNEIGGYSELFLFITSFKPLGKVGTVGIFLPPIDEARKVY